MSLVLLQKVAATVLVLLVLVPTGLASAQAGSSTPVNLSRDSPVSPSDAAQTTDTQLEDLGDARYEFGGRLPAPPSRARTEVRRLRRLAQQEAREAREAARDTRRQILESRQALLLEPKFKFAITTGVGYSFGSGLGTNVMGALGVGLEHVDGHRFDLLTEFQVLGPERTSFEFRSDRLSLDVGLRVLRLSRRAILLLHASAGILRARARIPNSMGASDSLVSWLAVVGGGAGVGVRVHPRISLSFRGGFRLTAPEVVLVVGGVRSATSRTQMRLSLAARFTL